MKKIMTWILVGDGKRARIFRNEGAGKGLKPVAGGEFLTELHPNRDLVSDKPGRVQESATTGRHAVEPRVDYHRLEKEKFAQGLAKVLDQAAVAGSFTRLVLVAPPRTLGDLRAALAPRTQALVVGEIDKDLTHERPDQIETHLAVTLTL
jgi:protein required for attachment to host cells